METLKVLTGASATVLAALIAAAITFLVAVFTKESKVSEFRQTWIDSLRNDLAQFAGIWWYLLNEFEQAKGQPGELDSRKLWETVRPEILKIEELQTRIELRLNPTEHCELIRQIHALVNIQEFLGTPFVVSKAAIERFTTESQNVLKAEWRVVKKGEPTYRWIKRFSLLAVLLAISLLVWIAWNSWHSAAAP